MKGKILDFSGAENQGVISGDDGTRYTFVSKEWKSSTPPQVGLRVDYDTSDHTALAVYLDQMTSSNVDNPPHEGFYRSSDDKMLAGVCAGLAHKWNFSRAGLRFATALVTIFIWVPLLAYIVCWVVFPARPTKKAG